MNKSEIEKKMIQSLKGSLFVSPNKLRTITGFGHAKVSQILDDLEYIKDCQGRRYFVPDVAEKIARMYVR